MKTKILISSFKFPPQKHEPYVMFMNFVVILKHHANIFWNYVLQIFIHDLVQQPNSKLDLIWSIYNVFDGFWFPTPYITRIQWMPLCHPWAFFLNLHNSKMATPKIVILWFCSYLNLYNGIFRWSKRLVYKTNIGAI